MSKRKARRYSCGNCGWNYLALCDEAEFPCSRCDGTCRLPCTDAEVTRKLTGLVKRLEREVER